MLIDQDLDQLCSSSASLKRTVFSHLKKDAFSCHIRHINKRSFCRFNIFDWNFNCFKKDNYEVGFCEFLEFRSVINIKNKDIKHFA